MMSAPGVAMDWNGIEPPFWPNPPFQGKDLASVIILERHILNCRVALATVVQSCKGASVKVFQACMRMQVCIWPLDQLLTFENLISKSPRATL